MSHCPASTCELVVGEAGVGKSVVANCVRWYAEANGFVDAFVICARTARAAHNVGGDTLHTYLSGPRAKTVSSVSKKLWQGKRVLIQDEYGMIALEFDSRLGEHATAAHAAAVDAGESQDDDGIVDGEDLDGYGAMHMIKFGDPFQLPIVQKDGHNPYFLAGALSGAGASESDMAKVLGEFGVDKPEVRHLRRGLELYRGMDVVVELDGVNHRFDDDDYRKMMHRWRFAYSELGGVPIHDRDRIIEADVRRINDECLLDGEGPRCPKSDDPKLRKVTLVCETNILRMAFGQLRAIGRGKAAGMKAIAYRSVDLFEGQPLHELSAGLAASLAAKDKTECGMPAVFYFAPGLACAPPKNVQKWKYLKIVNGSLGYMQEIKLHPDEPAMPQPGEARYDEDVWWLLKPPEYVVVEFPWSALETPLEGLPPHCVAVPFSPTHSFRHPLTKPQRTKFAAMSGGTKQMDTITIKRANVPLICVEGVTGYGAQCMSRVRNFGKCVFLKKLHVDTVKNFRLDADLVADWHRLQALKQATKLAHPIPEDTA